MTPAGADKGSRCPPPIPEPMWTTVRVPASSANLGPGFDALGLALKIYLICRFRPSRQLQIRVTGRDAQSIPQDETNLIWRTACQVAGDVDAPLPAIELEIQNQIPLGRGLGSSAAALTAGVVMANQLLALGWKRARILDEAAKIEGHPDNVAACVLGSLVASGIDSGGVARAVRVDLSPQYRVAVVAPDYPLATTTARSVLPDCYSREDAIFNLQRSAMLMAALATGTTSAFPTALEDRLHQPYRARLIPGLEQVLRLRAPGLLGCALSGAGPSILVFYEQGFAEVCDLVRQIFRHHGSEAEIMDQGVDTEGFQILE